MESNIIFEQLTKFSDEDLNSIKNLTSQLGSNYDEFGNKDLQEILDSSNTSLLIARDYSSKKIIGMVTIFVYRIPYTKKSYIDDFVIDENYRGKGIGTEFFKKALKLAKEKGARYIDFTSSPEKIQGNKFYEKLGFKKRDTNVYRFSFN